MQLACYDAFTYNLKILINDNYCEMLKEKYQGHIEMQWVVNISFLSIIFKRALFAFTDMKLYKQCIEFAVAH